VHKVDALVSDPPTPTYTPAPKTTASSSASAAKTTSADATKAATVPSQSPSVVSKSAAGRIGAATGTLLFVAGAFAALL
jgi:hypothetical protein